MVKVNSLKREFFVQCGFKTAQEGKVFLRELNLTPQDMRNITEDQLKQYLQDRKIDHDRQVEERKQQRLQQLNARPLTPEDIQRANAAAALNNGRQRQLPNIDRQLRQQLNFQPALIQLGDGANLFTPQEPQEAPINSDVIRNIRQAIHQHGFHNKLVFTQTELNAFHKKIQNTLNQLNHPDLFQKLNFRVYTLHRDEELGLYYQINGFYYEFGEFMLRFTEEAPPCFDDDGNQLSCVLACIKHQIHPTYLGKKRLQKLYTYNNIQINLINLDSIARDLEITIRVYDFEMKMWKEYMYSPQTKTGRSTLASIVVRNNHATCLKKDTKRDQNFNVDTQIDPTLTKLVHQDADDYYSHFTFENNELMIDFKTPDQAQTGVYFGTTDFEKLVEWLAQNNVYPSVVISGKNIVSVNFKIQNNEIYLRNSEFIHPLLRIIPRNYNTTISSCAMYLFRTHITNEIFKIADPVIAQTFKELCRPVNQITPTIQNDTNVYILDINKAYASLSHNLGIFNKCPDLELINETYDNTTTLKPGIYEIEMTPTNHMWVTHERLQHELTTNSHRIRYAILYHEITNTFYEFKDKLYNDELVVEVPDKLKKSIFNLLIGKCNPSHTAKTHTAIIHTNDLSRFALQNNKNIKFIIDISNNRHLVQFSYTTPASQGYTLSHIAAQIIQRCILKIDQTKLNILQHYPNAKFIGTMTDSIIFTCDTEVDFKKLNIPITDNIGDWSLRKGRHITAYGVGRYEIRAANYDIIKQAGDPIQQDDKDKIAQLIYRLNQTNKIKIDLTQYYNPQNDNIHELYIGEAGVGKSRFIADSYKNTRNYIKVAPTGIAACSIRSETISSFFKLGEKAEKSVVHVFSDLSKEARTKIQQADTIIIDECFMVSAKVMNLVNEVLKLVCANHKDFANKKLILVGDDRQLPSVAESFMDSDLYKRLNVETKEIEYDPAHARLMPEYRNMINYLRSQRSANELLNFINLIKPSLATTPFENSMNTYYRNEDVNNHNDREFALFPGEEKEYEYTRGEETSTRKYKIDMPIIIERNIHIKKGIYSGKLCKLGAYDNGDIMIYYYENDVRIEKSVKACPYFRAAFALTIHKVQSLTLPSINIRMRREDLGNPNATKLLYVAFTRVRSPDRVFFEFI